MDSLNQTQTDAELRLARDSSAPSWGDDNDTLGAFEDIEPTYDSIDDFGVQARAEFERLRLVLDLVDDLVPTQIDRYRIERVIGRGGMGVVHLAHDPELNRSVALKLVHAGPFVNRERLHARLQREARVLARLTHPNVVGVYDVGTHDGELFVAMEYVPGTNLRVWQESGKRTPDEILAAYLQAARGLSAVHRAGIVHRDFKPDNVMIADDGRVLVGDFGLADDRDLDSDPDAHVPEREGIARTQTGALMGTLRYMAPERLEGEPASKASDQFEFCVSLWEALAGRRPFLGEGRADLSQSMTSAPQGGGKIDRKIRRVLERGLARDPGQRYAGFDELIDALDQQGNRGRWWGLAGVAVIVALVVGRGMWEEPCEVEQRIVELQNVTLTLPEGSSDAAYQAVQGRFDRMVGELAGEAAAVCKYHEPVQLARIERWVSTVELIAEHSDDLPVTRTLETMSELQFERDREPPELVDPEVAALIDQAREHIATGRLAEAEEVTLQAAEQATERSDKAETSLRLGQLAAWRGRPAAALEHYENAIAHADAAGRDRLRLDAHLLATPVAITDADDAELAAEHHRYAGPLLDRFGLVSDDPAQIDHDEHDALLATEQGEHDVAMTIQQHVLDQRIQNGDPLAIAKSRWQLARIHHLRSSTVKDPADDERAAETGYRQVLAELDALHAAPGHSLRLPVLHNLGLLLFKPDQSNDEQFDEVEDCMNAVVEAGRSRWYVSALHILVSVLLERLQGGPHSSEAIAEAERLGDLLQLELQVDDLPPQVRLESWTIVALLHAVRVDRAALEAADATVYELASERVAEGTLTTTQRDVLLASHTMQLVSVLMEAHPELARAYIDRAQELTGQLPSDILENPDVAAVVAAIAGAADALEQPPPR